MSHKPYGCPHCHFRFRTKAQLHAHIPQHSPRLNRPASAGPSAQPLTNVCQFCGRRLKGNAGLNQHLRQDPECSLAYNDWVQRPETLADDAPNPQILPAPSPPGDQLESESRSASASGSERGSGSGSGREYGYRSQHGSDREGEAENDGESESEGDSESESGSESGSSDEEDEWEQYWSREGEGMGAGSPINAPHPDTPPDSPNSAMHDANVPHEPIQLKERTDEYGKKVYIQEYTNPLAGKKLRDEPAPEKGFYPDVGQLKDPESFEIAKLLLQSGMSARNRNCYLRLKRIRAMMPWDTNRAMMQDVDKLPHGPDWTVQAYEIPGDLGTKTAEAWCRNAFKAVKKLLGDKLLGKHIQFTAVRKYTSPDGKERIRDEIFTADWMWRTQDAIPDPHATVISVIISSDETKLTNFSGDKKAHPVYLTIGNIPKRFRRRISKRANILIGYLPVPKLDCISDKEKRKITRRKLFHTCMKNLLQPLQDAINAGGIEVRCADGGIRRIYPCLAAYIADFPEQCKVACTKTTHCPTCTVQPDQRGDYNDSPPRNAQDVLDAQEKHKAEGSAKFERLGLFLVKPFWSEFPYVDIGCFLTPDLLHQLHKGVMKDHLTKWVTHILSKTTIDERHKSMPEHHGMRHFKNGISAVSQWTGRELKEMAKVLLPVISDAADRSVIVAARALLDFMYLAHSSALTDSELDAMETALRTFHEHKEVFRLRGAVKTKKAFHGIPKIHMIRHYVRLIRELGTSDGYNTETSERLHIDFAKMGYRASNKVNATKQMALYIQRMEALEMHAAYLEGEGKTIPDAPKLRVDGRNEEDLEEEEEGWDEWEDEEEEEFQDVIDDAALRTVVAVKFDDWLINGRPVPGSGGGTWEVEQPQEGVNAAADPPLYHPVPEYVIAKTPRISNVSLDYLAEDHGATRLLTSLRTFVKRVRPGTHSRDIPRDIQLNIWSRVRLVHSPAPFKPSEGPSLDVIRAWPEKVDVFERVSCPPRFDTVLVLMNRVNSGIHRYRAARVRAIFEIPERYNLYRGKLVYVEMFNDIPPQPEAPVGLFTSTRSIQSGTRITAVFPLDQIRLTCHLAPRYRSFNIEPDELLYHSDVLQLCETFYINVFASYFWYELIRHWGQQGGET